MADYMHACPSCHTFYPPGVALGIRGGVCKCGAALHVTSITVEEFPALGQDEAARMVFSSPAAAPTQSRIKHTPMEFEPTRPASVGCMPYVAWFGVLPAGFLAFVSSSFNFGYLLAGFALALFLYLFACLCNDINTAVHHLGAIRWLMQHSDDPQVYQPVQAPAPTKKGLGNIIAAIVLFLLLVGFVVYTCLGH